MKKILLVTDGIFHPTYLGRKALHQNLKQMDGFSFSHVSSLEELPLVLRSYSALVLHYHHRTLSDAALENLAAYASQGGGILAIHAATASFKKNLPYFKILGGRFTGHGPVEKFEVERVQDSVFDGIENFSVRDELYLHELQPGIEVHFMAKYKGQDVPVVWTCKHGEGKICYAVPGHTTGTMQNTAYQTLLRRALTWVAA